MIGKIRHLRLGLTFALVSTRDPLFLGAADSTRKDFETAGSPQQDRMRYFSVLEETPVQNGALHSWAGRAIEFAHRAL